MAAESAALARAGSPHVLFVAYGSAHIAKVAPVVRALEACGARCTVMALTVGYQQALQLGLHPLGYKDFMHLEPRAMEALALGKALLPGNSHPNVDPYESACYLGVNYLEWVETFGKAKARQLYETGGRRAFKPVRFMQRLLSTIRPDVVVSTSSPRSEQAAIEAAVHLGISSLTMMDSFALPAEPYHRHQVRADVVTVMSDAVRTNLMGHGTDAQRIRVTGCPGFDGHFEPDLEARSRAYKARLGWSEMTVVLWAGSLEEGPGTPEEFAGPRLAVAVERELRSFIQRQPRVALIVRYHPSQYHHFQPATGQARVHVSNPVEEPIEIVIRAADTVLVQASTVGFEAALAGRRVLTLAYAPSVRSTGLDYAAMGYARPVRSLAELVPALESAEPLHSRPRLPEGPAAPRVAAIILELAQRPRVRK